MSKELLLNLIPLILAVSALITAIYCLIKSIDSNRKISKAIERSKKLIAEMESRK